jgi:hypothetical protein
MHDYQIITRFGFVEDPKSGFLGIPALVASAAYHNLAYPSFILYPRFDSFTPLIRECGTLRRFDQSSIFVWAISRVSHWPRGLNELVVTKLPSSIASAGPMILTIWLGQLEPLLLGPKGQAG